MKVSILFAALFMSSVAMAQDIFVITKNRTPKNELHYKANIENCKLKDPAVSGYWVLGEEDGRSEDLTRSELNMYKPRISYAKENEADFTIGAMDRLGSQLPNKSIRVRIEDCVAKAYLEIEGREIHISEIYVQISFLSVKYMIIKGTAANGEKINHKINL